MPYRNYKIHSMDYGNGCHSCSERGCLSVARLCCYSLLKLPVPAWAVGSYGMASLRGKNKGMFTDDVGEEGG